MAKYKIVHYINQFFAGIGGEEKADYTPELREGVVGPGMGLKAAPVSYTHLAMAKDYSWWTSAAKYQELYDWLIGY